MKRITLNLDTRDTDKQIRKIQRRNEIYKRELDGVLLRLNLLEVYFYKGR